MSNVLTGLPDGGDSIFLSVVAFILLVVGIWPFWFVAHWLGLPWRIVIKRDGSEVDEGEVRGWRRSQRRILEIAESAAAGTLEESLGLPPVSYQGGGKHRADAAALRDPLGRKNTPEQVHNTAMNHHWEARL
jgi:hypothetical protein